MFEIKIFKILKNEARVKAVFHSQYNTPIGIYSDSNVFQEFQNQTKGIMPSVSRKNNETESLSMQKPNEGKFRRYSEFYELFLFFL